MNQELTTVLETFFSTVPADMPPSAGSILAPVLELRRDMWHPACRITLFGTVKTGKTGLLNRVLGAGILPEHARQTGSWSSSVVYGSAPAATLVMPDGQERPVPFDELRATPAGWRGAVPREVCVAVPLPILERGITLIDTPGLLADEAGTEATYRLLERTDLAVMVLAADKILSAAERATAALVHDLLHGNIVFVVNRMDLVDPEDREDVLAWARVALNRTGNALVGEPCILIGGRAGQERDSPIADFPDWLATFSASERPQTVSALSRASVLRHRITTAVHLARAERDQATVRAGEARLHRLEAIMRERSAMHRAIAEARRRLETARTEMAALRSPFVAGCTRDTMQHIAAHHPEAREVPLQMENALADYTTGVNDGIAAAILGAPITAPPFNLRTWLFRLDVHARSDPVGTIGTAIGDFLTRPLDDGKSGRDAGAALGSWISKNVLGKDTEAQTEREVERLARAALTSIEAELDRHIAHLYGLLDEADAFYRTWTGSSPDIDALEQEERQWAALLQWLEGFLRAASRTASEIPAAWPSGANEPPRPDPQ